MYMYVHVQYMYVHVQYMYIHVQYCICMYMYSICMYMYMYMYVHVQYMYVHVCLFAGSLQTGRGSQDFRFRHGDRNRRAAKEVYGAPLPGHACLHEVLRDDGRPKGSAVQTETVLRISEDVDCIE